MKSLRMLKDDKLQKFNRKYETTTTIKSNSKSSYTKKISISSITPFCNKIVAKFGGTSLSDSRQFNKVKNIIDSYSNRTCVVVSAPGKRFNEDIKVTDLLIKIHQLQLQKAELKNQLEILTEEIEFYEKEEEQYAIAWPS